MVPRRSDSATTTERPPGNGTFVHKCHSQSAAGSSANAHWTVVRYAHPKRGRMEPAGSDGVLDTESRQCLECHDGVNATEARNTTSRDRSVGYVGDRQRSHPIGVRYRDISSQRRDVRLRPAGLLPATVRLPDGMVGCVSCHNLYARDRYHLAVPIEGSATLLYLSRSVAIRGMGPPEDRRPRPEQLPCQGPQ